MDFKVKKKSSWRINSCKLLFPSTLNSFLSCTQQSSNQYWYLRFSTMKRLTVSQMHSGLHIMKYVREGQKSEAIRKNWRRRGKTISPHGHFFGASREVVLRGMNPRKVRGGRESLMLTDNSIPWLLFYGSSNAQAERFHVRTISAPSVHISWRSEKAQNEIQGNVAFSKPMMKIQVQADYECHKAEPLVERRSYRSQPF